MLCKALAIFALVAAVNGGHAVSYLADPHVGAQYESTVRGFGGLSSATTYSKAVDGAFSSVRKTDTRVTNDAVHAIAAPVAYAHAAPVAVAHHGYAAPIAHHGYAAAAPLAHTYAHAAPVAAVAHHGYAAAPIAHHGYAAAAPLAVAHHGYAGAPIAHHGYAAAAPVAALSHHYSAAPAVASYHFNGIGLGTYAY